MNIQRYNPELQRRSLEKRQEKQEDFDNFVGRLKEYSKSDKPSKSCTAINVGHHDLKLIPRSMDSMGEGR